MSFLDKDGLTQFWLHIVEKLGNKVDKELGMGLSEQNYTTLEKVKLESISEGANSLSMNTLFLSSDNWELEDITGAFYQDVECLDSAALVYGNADINIDSSLGNVAFPYNKTEIKEVLKAWSCIDKCELFDGYVRFYCYFNVPKRDIAVNLHIFN